MAETTVSQRRVASVSVETERFERDTSPRRLPIVAGVAVVAIVAVLALLLWSRRTPKLALVETPPTLVSQKEAGKKDARSQEGAIEVNDETAELVGIKTEPATRGEIEETLPTTGRVLVAPNSEAIIGAKVPGRAVRVLAEPGQNVRAGQTVVIVDSPQIADLRGQLNEARSRLRLAEQNRARIARSENRVVVIQSRNKLDLAQTTLERKKRLAAIGVAATREVNEAETEYRNAKAEYDYQSSIQVTREQQQTISELEQARATVARLSQSLTALGAAVSGQGGTISIVSPISGTVIDRHISLGATVTEDKELMTVMNLRERRQYEVALNPDQMRTYNVSLDEVIKALRESNENFSGGFVTGTATEMDVRGLGRINSLEDVGLVVVAVRNGVPVLIRDLAEVRVRESKCGRSACFHLRLLGNN